MAIENEVDFMDQFHVLDKKGQPRGVYDFAIYQYLKEELPMFVLGGVPYLYKGGVYLADISGAKLMSEIRRLIYPEFIRSNTIRRIYNLFISDDELEVTADDLNDYPSHWICFLNGFYDPVERRMIPHDPKYRAVNQVPHEFFPDQDREGKTIESWLDFISDDPEDIQMLLEYAGYCLTKDTRQQKFLILTGAGGTGKSLVIGLIEKAVGSQNISNIPLEKLEQRFAAFGLFGKLLNSCADLKVTALEDTSVLKKAVGEDRIEAEAKGKDAFPFRSYAKLLFSVNELPIVKAERTNGFYRRLLVLTMNRQPETVDTGFAEKLAKEVDYFIFRSMDALSQMYQRGQITESKGSADAIERLRYDSDTVAAFLRDCTERRQGKHTARKVLYSAYEDYCRDAERLALTKNNFYRAMQAKGFPVVVIGGKRCFSGVQFRSEDLHLKCTWDAPESGEIPF